jgi:hypothetical protein
MRELKKIIETKNSKKIRTLKKNDLKRLKGGVGIMSDLDAV